MDVIKMNVERNLQKSKLGSRAGVFYIDMAIFERKSEHFVDIQLKKKKTWQPQDNVV